MLDAYTQHLEPETARFLSSNQKPAWNPSQNPKTQALHLKPQTLAAPKP
jgi:hypothetical protein